MDCDNILNPSIYLNPLTSRHKFDVSVCDVDDEYFETLSNNFIDCLLKRGRVYRSTGLRNLQYTTSSLKHFAILFTNHINRADLENIGKTSYNVEIKLINSNVQHLCPLKICVYRSEDDKEIGNTEVIYVGVFFSWRVTDFKPCREYLNLPFLFACGSQKLIHSLNILFENYFDIKISPVTFNQPNMKWLLAVLSQCINDNYDNIQCVYQLTSDDLKLDIKFPFTDLKNIWNTIHNDTRTEIKCEEVVTLNAAFGEHALESFGVDLNHFNLKSISLPGNVTLDSSGKIHISNGKFLDVFYRFLSGEKT